MDRLPQDAGAKPRRGRLGRGFSYVCWAAPRALGENGKATLYREIIKVASATFGDDMTPYWTGRAADGYLEKITKFFFVMREGQVVGWTGYHRLQVEAGTCLFIDATGVLPELQQTGVMTQVISRFLASEFIRNKLKPVYIAMRTESPVVYQAFYKAVGERDIYPNLLKAPPPHVERIGRYVAGWLKQAEKFDPATLRILNAFEGPCPWRWTGNADECDAGHPVCQDVRINSYFSERLRPEDAFIVIARMSATVGARLLGRALGKNVGRRRLSRKAVRKSQVKV
jgi:hypothetical protein